MIDQKLVLAPMLVVVGVTFVGFVRLLVARAAASKEIDVSYYSTYRDGREPEPAWLAARHWSNLFELPTVFYAACLTAYVTGAVTPAALACAWGFAIGRVGQSLVHLTTNRLYLRGLAFILSVLFLFGLWVQLAIAILGAA
ncbi:MAG TPA: MAPEG family protein [Novosphingobium sp.]|nr:MAPEG family protein [Novosphingobium sp.]